MSGSKPPFPHVSSCRSAQLNTGMSLSTSPSSSANSPHIPLSAPTSTVTSPAAKDVRTLIVRLRGLLWYPCVGLATDRRSFAKSLSKIWFTSVWLRHTLEKSDHSSTFTSDVVAAFLFFYSISCTFLPSVLQLTLRRFSSAAMLLYYHSQYSRFKIEGHSAKI